MSTCRSTTIREIGVIPHVFAGDVERIATDFRDELDSGSFDAAAHAAWTRNAAAAGRTGVEVVRMYGLTRATLTLIGVAVAGVLLWLATQVIRTTRPRPRAGEYWAAFGLVAAAGLVIALSQLLGGWTKWGWPRISGERLPARVPADARRRRLDPGCAGA